MHIRLEIGSQHVTFILLLFLVCVAGCDADRPLSWEEATIRSARPWTLPDGTVVNGTTVAENDYVVLLECTRVYSRFDGQLLLRRSQLAREDLQFLKKLAKTRQAPLVVQGVLPGDDPKLPAADREVTISLSQITLALMSYVNAHRAFPERAIYSGDGTPLLSWRVRILPYLGEAKLYDEFHLDEPWDSEHNRKLIDRIPLTYSAGTDKSEYGKTRFLAPVGKETFWEGRAGFKRGQLGDGESKTVAVVQAGPDRAVVWTSPIDLEIDGEDRLSELAGQGSKGFYAGFAGGRTAFLANELGDATIRKYFTRDRHEYIPNLTSPLPHFRRGPP
jgi:hypothetical protein